MARLNGRSGERNPQAVLTQDEVLSIRRLWARGHMSQTALARVFRVHLSTIHDIVRRKAWQHLPPETDTDVVPGAKGERNSQAKLTAATVRELRALAADGHSQAQLARRFGVGKTTVEAVLTGRTWAHVT